MSGNHNLWRFWSKLGSCGVPLCTHNPTINITFFLWNCNSRILLRIPILRTSPIVAEECASTTCASGIILSILLSSVTFYITCSSTFILKWAPNVNMDLCDLQIFWRVAHKNGQPGGNKQWRAITHLIKWFPEHVDLRRTSTSATHPLQVIIIFFIVTIYIHLNPFRPRVANWCMDTRKSDFEQVSPWRHHVLHQVITNFRFIGTP